MPSPAHQLLSAVIPVLRRSGEVVDPEQLRQDLRRRQAGSPDRPPRRGVRGCRVGPFGGAPFPVFEVVPDDTDPDRTILFLHGGGLVSGIDRFHWRYAGRLARATGSRVVLPAYPLTPDHTWRETRDPLFALFQDLAIAAPRGVVVAGDSAGGGLALALAQQAAADAGPQPTRLVLISPWVDLTGSVPGTEEMRVRDRWLRLTKLRLYGQWWAGDDDPSRPEVSPLAGEHAGLPPILVLCGTRDLLLPQVRELVRRAEAAGVDVDYVEEPDLIHVYPVLPVPEAGPALAKVAAFLG